MNVDANKLALLIIDGARCFHDHAPEVSQCLRELALSVREGAYRARYDAGGADTNESTFAFALAVEIERNI